MIGTRCASGSESYAARRESVSKQCPLARKQDKGVDLKVFEKVGAQGSSIVHVHVFRWGEKCEPPSGSEERRSVDHEMNIERCQSTQSHPRFDFDEASKLFLALAVHLVVP